MVMDYDGPPEELTEAQRLAAGGTVHGVAKIMTVPIHDIHSLNEIADAMITAAHRLKIHASMRNLPFADVAYLAAGDVSVFNQSVRQIARIHGVHMPRRGPRHIKNQEHEGGKRAYQNETPPRLKLLKPANRFHPDSAGS